MNARLRIADGVPHGRAVEASDLAVPKGRVSYAVGHVALAADSIALVGAAALARTPGRSGWVVWAYAALAFLSMHVLAPRRGRLEARVAKDAGWILQRLAAPLLVLVPLAGGAAPRLAAPVLTSVAAVLAARTAAYAWLRWARARRVVS